MKKLHILSIIIAILAFAVRVFYINMSDKTPNALEHACLDFNYKTTSLSQELPQTLSNKVYDALSTCLPTVNTTKPFVLCIRLGMDGSITKVDLSSDAMKLAKNNHNFADAAQIAISN